MKQGDYVVWKSGIEQYGKVVRVEGQYLIVRQYDSETGEYSEFPVLARKCEKVEN